MEPAPKSVGRRLRRFHRRRNGRGLGGYVGGNKPDTWKVTKRAKASAFPPLFVFASLVFLNTGMKRYTGTFNLGFAVWAKMRRYRRKWPRSASRIIRHLLLLIPWHRTDDYVLAVMPIPIVVMKHEARLNQWLDEAMDEIREKASTEYQKTIDLK
jgi:hypothetical protein